ncbi:MAG: Gfo/Idh/MocA family oxidoreductase [Phycisphaeraceae bacterium]
MRRRDLLAAAAALPLLYTSTARAADKPKIKAGQIGTKHAHASGKIGALRKFSDDYEVIGVVEPDEKQRKRVEGSGPYRDVPFMTQEELLNAKGLQLVAVETEVRDLVPAAARCIEAGMHIHLDKPAGESLPAFRTLLDAATKKKLTVQMGYMLRYNPAFVICYKAAREGWLGELFEGHAVMSKSIGAGERKKLAEYPGGSMFELGCHIIDSMVYVMGKPTKVTPFNRKMKPEQDELVDNQLAVLEYPKATATVRSALVEYMGGNRRQFVICGSEGTIDIRPLEPAKLLVAFAKPQAAYKAGYQEVELPKAGGRYDGEFIDLAKIIRGEKQADFSAEHDLAVHETVLRASGVSGE